jgi:salicylate hydroxylase
VGETGAALAITPNGGRVLERLGFSFTRARTCTIKAWDTVDGTTMDKLSSIDLSAAEKMFGASVRTAHRVDLHNELLRLATLPGEDLPPPVKVQLNSQVIEAHPDGMVVLQDGSIHLADLVVAADGLRSVFRDTVMGAGAHTRPVPSGLAAFRFLVKTSTLKKDPILSAVEDANQGTVLLLADIMETERERHMMWYACREWVKPPRGKFLWRVALLLQSMNLTRAAERPKTSLAFTLART